MPLARPSLVMLLASLTAGSVAAQTALDYPSVWTCDQDKFNWYCDLPPSPPQAAAPASAPSSAPSVRRDLKDLKTAEQMRAELKRREDLAVMQPTPDHIRDYLALWQVVQDKGALFADQWRRIVWQTPELDYAQRRPANNAAIKVFEAQRGQREEQQLKALARDHGLIFFFRSDCPYCHAMAPTLRMLSDRYGIEVLGVSVDGGSLPDFPSPRDGRMQATAWGVQRVPALFIGSRRTGDRAPIGFGVMALSEIVNRIFVLTGTRAGENF